jgi:DNA transformation protein and related proteins
MGKDPFVDHCLDLLSAGVGPVRSRAMFGGHGIYREGVMFALVADDALYLKVDGATEAAFREAGSRPFTWEGRDGRRVTMSYWEMPPEGLESPGDAREWAALALEAAGRSRR